MKKGDIGNRIRLLRGEESKYSLARRAGVSRATLGLVEAGKIEPSIPWAARVLDALGYAFSVIPRKK